MITPGLIRRSMLKAAQWRLLLLQLFFMGLCAWVGAHPWMAFFDRELSHLPRAHELTASLGSSGTVDILLQLVGPAGIHPEVSFVSGLVLSLLFGALFAAAVLGVSKSDDVPASRELLEGTGTYFGRTLRAVFSSAIPFAICGALVAGVFKWSGHVDERALTQAAADHALRLALAATAFIYVAGSSWIDAGRAMFVAQPSRRSAFFATFAGGWLVLRHPLRSLAIGATTLAAAGGLAGLVTILRQHVPQGSGGKILLAFLLSQLAIALLTWGRAARLIGFVELARADTLARARPAGTFEMAPPRTSPPAPALIGEAIAMPAVKPFAMSGPSDSIDMVVDAPQVAPAAAAEAPREIVAIATISAVEVAVPAAEPDLFDEIPAPIDATEPAAITAGAGTGEGA